MSGYLDVKLCSKTTGPFSTWKSWKRQWCILRPCPVKNGFVIVFHASANLSTNSQLEIPENIIVYRIASKTKHYAFGIFINDESEKPILYLAGRSECESQLWMSRIRALVNKKNSRKCSEKQDFFSVSIVDNNFSVECGFKGLFGVLKINSDNFEIFDIYSSEIVATLNYKHISDIKLVVKDGKSHDFEKILELNTNSEYKHGVGEILVYCSTGKMLLNALQKKVSDYTDYISHRLSRRRSLSEGSLLNLNLDKLSGSNEQHYSNISPQKSVTLGRYTRWYIEDCDNKVCDNSANLLNELNAYDTLSPKPIEKKYRRDIAFNHSRNSSSLDRRSSRGSGFYEEISEQPNRLSKHSISGIYESLDNFPRAKLNSKHRRSNPPPLPPRFKFIKSNSGNSDVDDKHNLNKLRLDPGNELSSPIAFNSTPIGSPSTFKTNGKNPNRFHNAFEAFRKRIKSESNLSKNKLFGKAEYVDQDGRLSLDTNCDLSSTPSKMRLFKNAKMERNFKKLDRPNAASCERLDVDSKHDFSQNRLSKSQDCLSFQSRDGSYCIDKMKRYGVDLSANWSLESSDENAEDLSVLCADSSFKRNYPVKIIVSNGDTAEQTNEDEYVEMSPPIDLFASDVPRPPVMNENNYLVMRSIKTFN